MRALFARLGPGLLYAGAAVGVSHLVQSTRAGTDYGFIMVLVVLVANIIKYPFFKAGPLFAAAEKRSLVEAFYKKGLLVMWLFYVVTVSAMFAVQAVVTLLTASVLASIFNLTIPLWLISLFLLLVCTAILLVGRYRLLDSVMKTVIVLLTITTIITLLFAFFSYQPTPLNAGNSLWSFKSKEDIFFLIALIGWMPAPLDISLWHSEWTLSDAYQKKKELSVKQSAFDFNIGYWGTTFLAMAFVCLGALILRGNGNELPSGGAAFAGEIIEMYTSTIGTWSFAFIAIAAFTTMFSTTLTVLDAYPRVLNKAITLSVKRKFRFGYTTWLSVLLIGALFVLIFQLQNMKQLVDFATTVSFLTAPIIASLIYWVVKQSKVKIFNSIDEWLTIIGLGFLYCFSFYYLWMKFL